MADYSTLLRDHVTLTCRSIDRIFLQAYVPKLQTVGWVCSFLRWQRGFQIPSSAAFGKIGAAYVAEVHRFAEQHGIPVIHFAKGECKEEIARPFLDRAAAEGGDGRVALIGIAQEKATAWRSWKAKGQEHAAHPHMEWGRQKAFINHFYFYVWDPEWGPAFWKTNAYAPYPIWICLLTELRAELLHVTGQIPVRVATVPAHDRIRRAVPGSQRVGGASARSAAGERGSVRAVPAA